MFIVVYTPGFFRDSERPHGGLILGTGYERAGLSLINAACVSGYMRLSTAKSHRRVAREPGCFVWAANALRKSVTYRISCDLDIDLIFSGS